MDKNLIEIENKKIGKIIVFLASKLDYLDKTHMVTSESAVNKFYQSAKVFYKKLNTDFGGIPFKFCDEKNTIILIEEKENKTYLNVKNYNKNYNTDAKKLIETDLETFERANGRMI